MKKIFTLLFALVCAVSAANATKVFATFGAPASQGSWDAETQTYTWTAGWSNLMPIYTFANGELAEYTALHLTTSDYVDGPYRVCFMNGGTAVATIAFYSAGEKNLVLSERSETKDIDLSQITSIQFGGASGAGSVKLDPASVYLVKPFALKFGEDGKAHITASDLDVTGNVTIDAQTGVITSTGTTGSISVSLPNCDFSAVTRIDVNRSGDDICNTMAINDAVNGNFQTWYGSKYGADFTAEHRSKAGQINKITWSVNAEGTMTISDIVITSNVINASDARLVDVTALPYKTWSSADADAVIVDNAYPANECGKAMGQGSTIFGDGNVHYLNYVDLTGYTSLKVKASAGAQIRICMNRLADPENKGTVTVDVTKTVDSEGYATFDLTGYAFSHLIAIKFPWNGQTHTVYSIEATNPNAEVSYIISGSGVRTSSVANALADESAKVIDATGVTGSGVELVSANPNCIFKANAGVLSNESNVMVDGTINNLVITDGKPFALPAEATAATAASYSRNAAGSYGTVCLPYAVESDETIQYYELESADAEKVTIKKVGNVAAGTPAIFKKDAGTTDLTFAGSGALSQAVDGSESEGTVLTLKGTYEKISITEAAQLAKTYYISGDKVMNATNSLTINPFRAYIEAAAASPAKFNLFESDNAPTVVNALFNSGKANIKAIYGVNGALQSELQEGINIVEFTNGTTKTVIVK